MKIVKLSLLRNLAALCGLALSLAACAQTPRTVVPSQPGPEGHLTIMTPGQRLNLDAPPADWIISGGEDDGIPSIATVTQDGVAALEIKSGPHRVIAVRQVNAMMLATPFLSWSWNLSNHGAGIHPVRLVVGFYGGAPADTKTGGQGNNIPPHDRALALVWGDTALKRGALSLPPPDRPLEVPVYTLRGGRENTRKWWFETVDLSNLYAKAWPLDDFRHVRITFVGLAAAPTETIVRGRISGISLTR